MHIFFTLFHPRLLSFYNSSTDSTYNWRFCLNFIKTCRTTNVRMDEVTRNDGGPRCRSTRRGDGVRRSSWRQRWNRVRGQRCIRPRGWNRRVPRDGTILSRYRDRRSPRVGSWCRACEDLSLRTRNDMA